MVDWTTYLNPTLDEGTLSRCRIDSRQAFAKGLDLLSQIYARLKPKRVICLGAGYLNDIPVDQFLLGSSEVTLVDWVPQISERGFGAGLIRNPRGKPECLLCMLGHLPNVFCSGSGRVQGEHHICDNYLACESDPTRCNSWHAAEQPTFVTADVTLGRATAFAESVDKSIRDSKSPARAFRVAIDAAQETSKVQDRVAVAEGTMDLVTSSMLASQFEHEPYDYFFKQLLHKFGEERIIADKKKLTPLYERLRSALFQTQMEGHAAELYRLVEKTEGRVYLSTELLRTEEDRTSFFLVPEMHTILETLGRYFSFDMDPIPLNQVLHEASTGGGTSVVQNYVLKPRNLTLA